MRLAHPVDHRGAAVFHLGFVIGYALCIWFHGVSAWRHWCDSRTAGS